MGEEKLPVNPVSKTCASAAPFAPVVLFRISDGLSFTMFFHQVAITGGPQVGNLEAK